MSKECWIVSCVQEVAKMIILLILLILIEHADVADVPIAMMPAEHKSRLNDQSPAS